MKYILWQVNYQALRVMLADAPRYVKDKKSAKGQNLMGFFQSRLKE